MQKTTGRKARSGITLERTAQIESRTIGQIHIQQVDVRRRGAGETECRGPVGSGPSFVAEALEDVAEHLAHLGFVFNNKDGFVHLGCPFHSTTAHR